MARDYRYGHKKKPVATRRSQTGETQLEQQAPSPTTTKSAPLTQAAKKNKTSATEPPVTADPVEPMIEAVEAPPELPSVAPTPEPAEAVSDVPARKPRKKKPKSKLKESSEKAKKEDEEHKTDAQIQAEKAKEEKHETHESDEIDEGQEGKKSFFWLKATGLVVLLFAVTGWLVYAPFILAFALEMGWIDEETRMRWDSREARQPQIALVEKVLPPNPELLSPKEEEVLIEPEVAFTFYEELPKAVIQLTAQPLPVRTRAPTYLQLSSFANAKDAEEERSRLAQKGYLSQVSTQLNHQGRPNYLLRMGPYEDQRVINRLKVELQRLGLDAKEVTMTSVIKAQEKTQEKMQEKLQEQRSQEKNADKANTGR